MMLLTEVPGSVTVRGIQHSEAAETALNCTQVMFDSYAAYTFNWINMRLRFRVFYLFTTWVKRSNTLLCDIDFKTMTHITL